MLWAWFVKKWTWIFMPILKYFSWYFQENWYYHNGQMVHWIWKWIFLFFLGKKNIGVTRVRHDTFFRNLWSLMIILPNRDLWSLMIIFWKSQDHDGRSFCWSPLWLYCAKNLYFHVPIFWKSSKIYDFATMFLISLKNIFDIGKN